MRPRLPWYPLCSTFSMRICGGSALVKLTYVDIIHTIPDFCANFYNCQIFKGWGVKLSESVRSLRVEVLPWFFLIFFPSTRLSGGVRCHPWCLATPWVKLPRPTLRASSRWLRPLAVLMAWALPCRSCQAPCCMLSCSGSPWNAWRTGFLVMIGDDRSRLYEMMEFWVRWEVTLVEKFEVHQWLFRLERACICTFIHWEFIENSLR